MSLEIGRSVKLGAADVAVVRLRTWSFNIRRQRFQNPDSEGPCRVVIATVTSPVWTVLWLAKLPL